MVTLFTIISSITIIIEKIVKEEQSNNSFSKIPIFGESLPLLDTNNAIAVNANVNAHKIIETTFSVLKIKLHTNNTPQIAARIILILLLLITISTWLLIDSHTI